ncbi:MAG: molybdopterin-dependent oxidoreductase [Chloroflexi bacterium]|nr:molybdopterin-dependent oxidoreductase [Chloroflexota bacterium]
MSGISRRNFLKVGLAGAGALAVENKLVDLIKAGELIEGGASVSRTTNVSRVPIPSICTQCEARCGIMGFLEEGRLVKIEGNPRDLNSRGRSCARGQAGLNLVYNPDRLLYPIKRVGLRGQGKWKRISWDEAFTEVAAKIKPLRDANKQDGFVFYGGPRGIDNLTGRFLKAFGASNVVQEDAGYSANRWVANEIGWGAREEIPDVASSKFILNFGANPYEAHPHFVPFIQRLIDGRMNGARLVTFDSRLSNTASKSDRWFPIRPGADGIVALAMASVIMQRGLYDREFVLSWMNYEPDALTQHLLQYTPEMAERESDIRASDIVQLAVEFGRTKPAVAISGGGLTGHSNGVQNQRAVALLNAITGNIDVRGGACLPRFYQFDEPKPAPDYVPGSSQFSHPDNYPLASYSVPQTIPSLIKALKDQVDVLMTVEANPVFTNSEPELTAAVLKDEKLVPHFFAVDTFISETAALADIVLPASTYLESWSVHSGPAYQLIPTVLLAQPVVVPQGESLPVHDILIELARQTGGGMEKYFGFGTMESYISSAIAGIDGLAKAGGMKYLKANGVWLDASTPLEYKSYQKKGFNTASGKFEVYSKKMQSAGFSALPTYDPIESTKDLKEDEFVLTTFQSSVHNSFNSAESAWLSEIDHDNPVWINADVARVRGIKRGDKITLTSVVGVIVAKAQPSHGIHPNIVAMCRHAGHSEYGKIARGVRFESKDPNTKLIWWDKHGSGVQVSRLIPVSSDPIGGGQAWMDTKVKISKA